MPDKFDENFLLNNSFVFVNLQYDCIFLTNFLNVVYYAFDEQLLCYNVRKYLVCLQFNARGNEKSV